MKFLRTLHLYLGCLFAPMLIFFAVSGSWQLFNWHESKKDHTYTAPRVLTVLSDVHKDAHIPPTPGRKPTPLRYFMLAGAVGLVRLERARSGHGLPIQPTPARGDDLFAQRHYCPGNHALGLQVEARDLATASKLQSNAAV